MPRTIHQKAKVLYVMRMLLQESDEDHPLSTEDIISKLNEAGIRAERKSIYSDIETLRDFGLDVHGSRGRSAGYYVGERDFELPEIKLLIDSVQSSKFITERKTMQLIRKLAGLMSVHEAALMKRQLYVKNRIKSMNESIYYNVDAIHQAIAEDKQIEFRYCSYTLTKEKKFRRNGRPYRVSPLALSWAEENYYLIAYEAEAGKIKHFRVDKMDGIKITEMFRQGKDLLPEKEMGEYTRKNFSMFGGEEQTVTLRFSNRREPPVLRLAVRPRWGGRHHRPPGGHGRVPGPAPAGQSGLLTTERRDHHVHTTILRDRHAVPVRVLLALQHRQGPEDQDRQGQERRLRGAGHHRLPDRPLRQALRLPPDRYFGLFRLVLHRRHPHGQRGPGALLHQHPAGQTGGARVIFNSP